MVLGVAQKASYNPLNFSCSRQFIHGLLKKRQFIHGTRARRLYITRCKIMSHLWRMSGGKFGPLLYLHWLPCAFLFYFWCPKYYQPEPRASRLFATGCQSMCCAHAGARLPSHVNMQEVNLVVSSFIFSALFFIQ